MKRTFICAFLLFIAVCFCQSISLGLDRAATDTEADIYGFVVDSNKYTKTVWYKKIRVVCKLDGNIVGENITMIGMTRSKTKSSDGKCYDQC